MKLLEELRYNLLKVEYWLKMNFGRDEFGGIQIWCIHIIPKKNVSCGYLLQQQFDREVYSFSDFYVVF